MDDAERRRLNRMLGGDPGPSVQEKEEVLRAVLAASGDGIETEPESALRRRWPWGVAVGTAAAVVAVVLVVLLSTPVNQDAAFTARGTAKDETKSFFELECVGVGAPNRPCRRGDTLVFKLRSSGDREFFSAAALDREGQLIWYFPSADRASQPVPADGVLDTGIVLDAAHRATRYRVLGVFSSQPLTKEMLRETIEAFAGSGATAVSSGLSVVEVPLELQQP